VRYKATTSVAMIVDKLIALVHTQQWLFQVLPPVIINKK
jgi:hypothetical protein